MKLEERLLEVSDFFQKYKSPISVATRMAQFVLESGAGESELFKKVLQWLRNKSFSAMGRREGLA